MGVVAEPVEETEEEKAAKAAKKEADIAAAEDKVLKLNASKEEAGTKLKVSA